MKRVLKYMIFVLCLLITLTGVNYLLEPKYTYRNTTWPTTSTFNQFYRMKKNTVDLIFLGSSYSVNAFSPQYLYDTYGYRSYNLGSEQQSLFLSYYWLKEALRFQSPEIVVLEGRNIFPKEADTPVNTNEAFIRKALDPMHWSSVKTEAVHELCLLDPAQQEISYYLTNIRFHNRWKELSAEDLDWHSAHTAELKGYYPMQDTQPEHEFHPFDNEDKGMPIDPDPLMLVYLEKIQDLCLEKGIHLIVINIPAGDMYQGMQEMLMPFIEAHDIEYYNLSEINLYESLGVDEETENAVDHADWRGSLKLTDFVGRVLLEKGYLEAKEDSQWEDTKDFYQKLINELQ